MKEITNEILKARIEKVVASVLSEFEELSTRRLERVSQLIEFDFSSELRFLTDDWRLSFGRLSGVRRLFDVYSDVFAMDVVDFIDSAMDSLQGVLNSSSDKLLELSRAALARSVDDPVFAPTTQATETILISPVLQVAEPVTPIQGGEKTPSCNVCQFSDTCNADGLFDCLVGSVSLQSLGASLAGQHPDLYPVSSDLWRDVDAVGVS